MKKVTVFLVVIFIGITTILKAQSFGFPLDTSGWYLTQNFGGWNKTFGGYHLGEDYVANNNIELPVYAASNGIVKHVQNHPKRNQQLNYGYVVIIEHTLSDGSKVCSLYGHMRAANITKIGKSVIKGELIGYLSNDPNENGGYSFTHLHFGIRSGGYTTVADSDGGWRYRGYGPSYIRDLWYDSGDFVASHQNTPIPTLSAPNDNVDFTKGNDISFTWSIVTNAVYYEIWIDNSNVFGSPEIGFNNGVSLNWINNGVVSSNNFKLTKSMQDQLPQNVYYWKVRALDNNMNPITDWSSGVRSFKLYDPLTPPTLSTPSDNAEFTKGSDISFTWTSVTNASYYEIWIDNSNVFGSPEIGFNNGMSSNWINYGIVSSNNFTLTTIGQNQLPQNLYYWKVRALDSSKNPITDWSSDVRTFKLFNLFSPPTLSSPSDKTKHTKGNDIVFSWSILPNAANYEIWIDNNSGFGSPEVGFYNGASLDWVNNGIVNTNNFILTTSLQDQLTQNLYYWKVRALDGSLNPITEWSNNILSFELLENQGSKTINIDTAGTLLSSLTSEELNTITNLTITGKIDARDFKTMRDNIPALTVLDISDVSIMEYIGTAGTYTTDETLYQRNQIPTYSFFGKNLTKILLPLTVTSIGNYAFQGSGLTGSLTISSSLSYIGSYAFSPCNGITDFVVDASNQNFSSKNGVLFNKNQTILLQYPQGKTGSYVVPATVTSIKRPAFRLCVSLSEITIGKNVTSIDSYTFQNCSGLTKITVNNDIPPIITTTTFYNVDKSTCILLVPTGTKPLYQSTANWKDFTNIVEKDFFVPKTIQLINAGTLSSLLTTDELNTVTNLTLTGTIDARDFKTMRDDMPQLSVLDISHVTIVAYTGTEGTISGIATYTYLINSIPSHALISKNKLSSILLPLSITSIESSAFVGCSGLFEIIIPNSVTSIESQAFQACTGLSSISIGSSVTWIGEWAFAYCTGLTSIYVSTSTPLVLIDIVFPYITKSNCTLYVPAGSKAAYQAANQWKDFTNIVEFATAVPTVNNATINIYPNPVTDGFRIKGIEGKSYLKLTDLSGKLLLSKQVVGDENINVNGLPAGMYMINLSINGVSYQKKFTKK